MELYGRASGESETSVEGNSEMRAFHRRRKRRESRELRFVAKSYALSLFVAAALYAILGKARLFPRIAPTREKG